MMGAYFNDGRAGFAYFNQLLGLALSDLESLRALTRMRFEVCPLSCGEVVRCRDYMGSRTLVSRIVTGSVPHCL